MATTIAGFVVDGPDYKIFDIVVPELDAVTLTTALTFGAAGMSNFAGTPQLWWATEITSNADAPTVNADISIYSPSTTGFSTFKPSVTAATVQVHTDRVWMTTKSIGEL